jgi:hypothetical protein
LDHFFTAADTGGSLPGSDVLACRAFGIQSPANMVFLFVIFILLIKTFNLTLEISQLQYKIQELVQKIALDENKKNKEADKEEK